MGEPARTIRLYPADNIPERGRDDSLIAALIEKLPHPGTAWPADQRQAWLDMMATAFTVLYGGPAGGGMTRAAALARRSSSRKPTKRGAKPARPQRKAPIGAGPEFYIDKQGFARRAGGDRILAGDVTEILVDQRGEHGDLGSIIWADDTRGTRGHSLDIQAAS